MSIKIILDGSGGCGINMYQYIGSKATITGISPGAYSEHDWKPDPRLQPQRIVFKSFRGVGNAENLLLDSTSDWRKDIGSTILANCDGVSFNKRSGAMFGLFGKSTSSTSAAKYNLPNPFSNCINISTGNFSISICPSSTGSRERKEEKNVGQGSMWQTKSLKGLKEEPECPAGTQRLVEGGDCVPIQEPCPEGKYRMEEGGPCYDYPICPSGQYYYSDPSKGGQYTCVSTCPEGTTLWRDECHSGLSPAPWPIVAPIPKPNPFKPFWPPR